jgi:hypothetical protein
MVSGIIITKGSHHGCGPREKPILKLRGAMIHTHLQPTRYEIWLIDTNNLILKSGMSMQILTRVLPAVFYVDLNKNWPKNLEKKMLLSLCQASAGVMA